MKKILPFILLILSVHAKADFSVEEVDPSLVLVSQGFNYRLLVFSACSPEHCWSETHLQSVSFGLENPEILCTTKISEIEYGHVITNINWQGTAQSAKAMLSAHASHGGFDPRIVELSPSKNCSYTISGASEAGF